MMEYECVEYHLSLPGSMRATCDYSCTSNCKSLPCDVHCTMHHAFSAPDSADLGCTSTTSTSAVMARRQ